MIRSVTLRRFKRFDEVKFDLIGNVVLAGPNNSGKTTVLQAIAAWSLAFRHWQRLNDYQRHGGAYTYAPLARQAFSAVPLGRFDLLWRNRAYGGKVEIALELSSGRTITMELHSDSTEQIRVRPASSAEPDWIRELAMDVVYVATVSGLSLEEPVYQADYIETLLGRQRPSDVIRNLLLQASQGNRWQRLTAAVDRMFGITLLPPTTFAGAIVAEYREREGGPSFDLASAGSGFQQVVLLLASLFTRQGSVVLVDEPDAHLHVFLQDTIFDELRSAAVETRSQLVIATHSEVILDSAAPDEICLLLGTTPRRLASDAEVITLKRAIGILRQSDVVEAREAPGILYLEGYPDLELLRAWANVLGHPVAEHLNRRPFWRPVSSSNERDEHVRRHYDALKLVRPDVTATRLVDSDGKQRIGLSLAPERGVLNRIAWNRYESESYLLHPAPLERFTSAQTGLDMSRALKDAFDAVFAREFGSAGPQLVEDFYTQPFAPPPAIERFLQATKARTELIGPILAAGGLPAFPYTRLSEVAAQMLPEEIHPEIREKLDFIRQAFGL